MAEKPQQPNLPDGTWAIAKEDREKILKFGRELTAFINGYVEKNSEGGRFHLRLIFAGFQYFGQIVDQRGKLMADDAVISQETMQKYGLGTEIVEPFLPIPEPTEEEKAKFAEDVKKANEIEDASITPDKEPADAKPAETLPAPADEGAV